MFIASLFTITMKWNQPRCLSADAWIKREHYICTMEIYSAKKKNKDIGKKIGGTRNHYVRQNKIDVEKQTPFIFFHMLNLE